MELEEVMGRIENIKGPTGLIEACMLRNRHGVRGLLLVRAKIQKTWAMRTWLVC